MESEICDYTGQMSYITEGKRYESRVLIDVTERTVLSRVPNL